MRPGVNRFGVSVKPWLIGVRATLSAWSTVGSYSIEQLAHGLGVTDIQLNQFESIRRKLGEIGKLEFAVVEGIEVVETNHAVAARQQRSAEM